MAITGSGTEQDPWIVHSYDEIKEAISGTSYGANKGSVRFYIKLANDVDCNNYGTAFEWETISVADSVSNYEFDLDGHAIKNFKIRQGHSVFQCGGYTSSTIKNGKILNIYAGRSAGFMTYKGGIYYVSNIEDMSISMTIQTGLAGASIAMYVAINRCAIYIEGTETNDNNSLFYTRGNNVGGKFVDSDILLDVILGQARVDEGNETTERCRYRGSCSGGARYNGIFGGTLTNCVLDIYLDISTSYRIAYNDGGCTGVINEDKIPSDCRVCGMTKVTSQEIINGDALRAKGFEVTNVVT